MRKLEALEVNYGGLFIGSVRKFVRFNSFSCITSAFSLIEEYDRERSTCISVF